MFFPNVKLQRGFTLVEILIAISLMGILTVVVIPRIASFNATQSLEQSALDFVAVLEDAKSKSASSQLYNGVLSEYGVMVVSGSEYCSGQRLDGSAVDLTCDRRHFLPAGVAVLALFPAIGSPKTVFDRITGVVLAGSGSYMFTKGSTSVLVSISSNGRIEIN
ncbi:MAG: type II secretion system protein [bacterium]